MSVLFWNFLCVSFTEFCSEINYISFNKIFAIKLIEFLQIFTTKPQTTPELTKIEKNGWIWYFQTLNWIWLHRNGMGLMDTLAKFCIMKKVRERAKDSDNDSEK